MTLHLGDKIRAGKIKKEIARYYYEKKMLLARNSIAVVEFLMILYSKFYKYNKKDREWRGRDRVIIPRGNVLPALFVVLAEYGLISHKEFKKILSHGKKYEELRHEEIVGVDAIVESPGQAIALADGIGFSEKINEESFNIYCIIEEGDMEEQEVIKGIISAAELKMDHLCVIYIYNNVRKSKKVPSMDEEEFLDEEFKNLGWNIIKLDGHDFNEIEKGLKSFQEEKEKPTLIIVETAEEITIQNHEENQL